MLERVDTLIAFATIMLGVSLLITIINQMISSLLGHRATYLKDGLMDLLETLDPELKPNAEKIADDVLTHKLASDSIFARVAKAPQRWKLATTIRPEELAKLLTLVSNDKPYAANIQAILDQINPTVSREAGMLANTMNKLAPNATASADQLLKELSDKTTKALGRLEAAFNSTMDRVQQRFTLQMRIWTIVFSLVFALVYHLDAFQIYTQLTNDPAMRASLSNASDELMKKYMNVNGQPSSGNAKEDSKNLSQAYKDIQQDLSSAKVFEVPKDWWKIWELGWNTLFRILATAGFLSLGAPFWYNTLKGLANLRSQVAQKQDSEAVQA
ncbi:MAG TPA: hypothetical protein VGJ33_03145 [Candidatus Angelobacter sp.]